MKNMTELIQDIAGLHEHIEGFWGGGGWAPGLGGQLLQASRLDRQTGMAKLLPRWLEEDRRCDAELILAWAALGSLVEGALKWFLCVYHADYANWPVTRGARKSNEAIDPDELLFNRLIRFYDDVVWSERQKEQWTEWLHAVREKRNAIHTYQDREIGTWDDWEQALGKYLLLLRDLEGQVPYPW